MKQYFLIGFALLMVGHSVAQPVPALYAGADLKLGAKLIAEGKCAA